MKGDRTTTTLPPGGLGGRQGAAVLAAASDTLRRLNGGLPPNLHLAPRSRLLAVIKDLHAENQRLRLTEAKR